MLFLTFWPFTSKYYYYTNNLAKSCFWPVWPFMSKHKKKQRKISFSEPLDMPPLKSFYPGLTKQKCFTTRCVPSSTSGDLCFLLFLFSCGVSSTRTKNNERSISQKRLIGHAPLKSLLVIVDTRFYETKRFLDGVGAFIQLRWSLLFSFSFYFWNFFYKNKLKSNERSIFQNRLICHDILWSLSRGFTKHKGLHQGACLPPTLVISAFS